MYKLPPSLKMHDETVYNNSLAGIVREKITDEDIADLKIDLYRARSLDEFLNSGSAETIIPIREDMMSNRSDVKKSECIEKKVLPKETANYSFPRQVKPLEKAALIYVCYPQEKYYTQNHVSNMHEGSDVITSKDIVEYENSLKGKNMNSAEEDLEFISQLKAKFPGLDSIIVNYVIDKREFPQLENVEIRNGIFPVEGNLRFFVASGKSYVALKRIVNSIKTSKR